MPAKFKSKKSPLRAERKPVRKGVPRASFSQEVKQPAVAVRSEDSDVPVENITPQSNQASAPAAVSDNQVMSEAVISPPVILPVENLDQILDSAPETSVTDGKNRLMFVVGIVGALCLIGCSIVVFFIYLGSKKAPQAVVQTKTVPTATPTPAFVRSSVTFEVINGSGVAGAATKAGDSLKQMGYTVLTVGNGKKQTHNELFLAKGLTPAAISEVLADINSLFTVSSSSGDLIGSTASARIILGNK